MPVRSSKPPRPQSGEAAPLIKPEEVFDRLNLGVTILNAEGVIVYCNQAQGLIDGLSPESVLHKHFSDIRLHRDETRDLIARALKEGQALVDNDVVYRDAEGWLRSSRYSVIPLSEGGKLTGLISFMQPVGRVVSPPVAGHPAGAEAPPETADGPAGDDLIIGRHPVLIRAVELARGAAVTPSPIMLCGETGTGKEVFARHIHAWSSKRKEPYVAVNCAAIPASLAESLLFGTARGSFTGATESPGLFEQANGGILFLDEVDSMSMELQPKLLRVIQEMKVRRIGSSTEKKINVKIITAVGRSLKTLLQSKRLRSDLFYRLGVNIIELPPLRERLSDLSELINHFILKLNFKLGQHFRGVSPEVLKLFNQYQWPGNVRELEHALEAGMNAAPGLNWITVEMLPKHLLANNDENEATPPDFAFDQPGAEPAAAGAAPEYPADLGGMKNLAEEQERQLLVQALKKTYGNITLAAERLGISRQLMHYKMKKLNISRSEGRG